MSPDNFTEKHIKVNQNNSKKKYFVKSVEFMSTLLFGPTPKEQDKFFK